MAARSGLIRLCGLAPELKWPNDLLVRDRKLGGILAELVDDSPRVVVGLGLNLQWPGPVDVGGTCVRDEVGVTLAPRAMLDIFLAELELLLPLLDTPEGRDELTTLYNETLATLGRVVRVERMDGAPLVGRAVRVLADGSLCVEVDGAEVTVRTGDVVHLREERP
jgi:BirA family biotin operon repressor/biotin-[acetyl-CoA-carboxylase] ligase